MSRVNLTDGSGQWFDSKKSVCFKEKTRWNGNNHISIPTGSQWEHEALYYTKSGNWVLHEWSQWQGTLEQYSLISQEEAIRWLCVNECWGDDEFNELPENVQEEVDEGIAANEL